MTGARLIVPAWAQGRSGLGQGGWSSARFAALIDEPVTISLRAPIPLETELRVVTEPDGWSLVDPSPAAPGGDPLVIMRATPRPADHFERVCTASVGIEAAREARSRFPATLTGPAASAAQDDPPSDGTSDGTAEVHNAPGCFSCGLGEPTMRVWPGPLDDGTDRVASDWTIPDWVAHEDGRVDPSVVWTALDCTCGFYVGHRPVKRSAVTVQYAVEVLAPLVVGRTYVVVGFSGPWASGWDGRKRGACSAVFDAEGRMMARSNSFWVAVDDSR